MEWHWRKSKAMKYMFDILLGKNTENAEKKKKGKLNHAGRPSISILLHPAEYLGGLACTQRPPGLLTSPWVSRTWERLGYLFPSLPLCGVAASWLHVLTEGHSSVKQPSSQVLSLQVQEITPSPNPTGLGWEWGLPWEPVPFFAHMLQIVPSYTLFKLLSLRVSSLFCWSPELYNYNYYPDISSDKHWMYFPRCLYFWSCVWATDSASFWICIFYILFFSHL